MIDRLRPRRDESGAFIALWALLVVGLITMAAIAIDLGALQQDRRLDRSVTDSAATAGADKLSANAPGPFNACEMAWNIAARNLGYTPPGAGSTPCSGATSALTPATTCNAGDPARTVSGSIGPYSVTVTTPVPDDSSLMSASAIGGPQAQGASSTYDGTPCSRVGVAVSLTRKSFFGGVVGVNSASTTVHSVAKATTGGSFTNPFPALVALDRTACRTIDAEPGHIHVFNNGDKPGIMQADSDGSGCSSGDYILNIQGSASLVADPGTPSGTPGIINYYATQNLSAAYVPNSVPSGYSVQPTQMLQRVTRSPVDQVYHCSSGCTDYIGTVQSRYAGTGTPSGFNTYTGSCSPGAGTISVPSNGLYISCPNFTVGSTVTFTPQAAGTTPVVVFDGYVSINSGGTFAVNTTSNDPMTGLPVATVAADSLLVIRGQDSSGAAISMQSSTTHLDLANTVMVSKVGGANFNGGPDIHWSPAAGTSADPVIAGLKNLVFWTEASTSVTFQGGPTFDSDGIFVMPNAQLLIRGSGTLDARQVQFWCDRAQVNNNSANFLLRPDPSKAIGGSTQRAALIR